MKDHYLPPNQGAAGQVFDSVILLILIYVVLLAPLLLGLTAPGKVEVKKLDPATVSWQELDQNPTMVAQWEKLGYTPAKASELINMKFDYTIKLLPFIITAIVLIGYIVMLLRMSDKEYKEVISEKFD